MTNLRKLQGVDLLAAFHTASVVIYPLIWVPIYLRPLPVLALCLIILWERGDRLASGKEVPWPGREPEPRWSRPLPCWVAWLLRLDMPALTGEVMTIRWRLSLVAEARGYALRSCPGQPLAWRESAQAIGVVLLALLPACGLVLTDFRLLIAVCTAPALIWILLRRLAFQRYLREELKELPEGVALLPEPAVKLFTSYLPQKDAPAFARRTWSGQQEIYLDAWLQVPVQVLQVLLLHEQGHIARGHTTLLRSLWDCQLGAVLVGLLAAVCLPQFLDELSGPVAALCLLLWSMLLMAPLLGKLLCLRRWENEADQWAITHLGPGALEAARLYLRRCYSLEGAASW